MINWIRWVSCVLLLMGSIWRMDAQEQRFRGGLIAGINMAQIDGDRLYGYNKLGFNAGVKVNTILTERWQLSLELIYSQQGSSRSKNDLGSSYQRFNLNYVEVPVMINFLDWKLHFSGGLVYGRLIDFTVEDIFGEDITDAEEFNDNALSYILGATYFINDNWGASIHWQRSLMNMEGDPDDSDLLGKHILIRGVYMF